MTDTRQVTMVTMVTMVITLLKLSDMDTLTPRASEVARIEMMLADEENKRAKWRIENIRRRHNYLPLIMELLRSLATRGELVPIYQKAKEKAAEAEKRKKKKGKA